jgi:hypothetical protein
MSEDDIAASRRVIEEGFGGDPGVVDELCTEGFVGHDPVAGDLDREGLKQSMAGYRHAFPDLKLTVDLGRPLRGRPDRRVVGAVGRDDVHANIGALPESAIEV